MKDKEWLKEEIKTLLTVRNQFYPHDEMVDLGLVLLAIDQLDEPQKPVIPQFVADYIESQDDPIYEMCINYEMWGVNGDDGTTSFTREVAEWFDDNLNVENYYRACIDGYEVEKEKKYRVVFPYKWETVYLREGAHGDFDVIETETYGTQYTEAEIKAIDKRYWAFAEEVNGND